MIPDQYDYPCHTPIPTFTSPILCPFVKPETGSLSTSYGAWDEVWSPMRTLHSSLMSLAAIIHFGPHLEHMPESLAKDVRFHFHPFNPKVDSPIFMTMKSWFRLAINFFCRVYTLNDTTLEGEEEDVSVDRDILAASIQAIKGLLKHAADIGIQSAQLIPQDRRNLSRLRFRPFTLT